MVRRSRQSQSAACGGTSSPFGTAWRSSVAAVGPSGASRRGRVAEVGRHSLLLARRSTWSSTSLSPQAYAAWVLLRLASRSCTSRCFEVALYNLPVKWDCPRRAPVVSPSMAVPPWSAPYLHR